MYAGDVQRRHPSPTWPSPACPTVRAGSHKQRFSTSQPTAELQPVKTNVHRAVDIQTSAAASIKLELWPLRNPVSSIQSRWPLIYADPPNVLTGNDRLNIQVCSLPFTFLPKCTHRLRPNYPPCPATFSGPALVWSAISAKSLGLASNVRVPPPPQTITLFRRVKI